MARKKNPLKSYLHVNEFPNKHFYMTFSYLKPLLFKTQIYQTIDLLGVEEI